MFALMDKLRNRGKLYWLFVKFIISFTNVYDSIIQTISCKYES
jgi:hypothetical protein